MFLELFKGTGSVGRIAKKYFKNIVSVDIDKKWSPQPTYAEDILKWDLFSEGQDWKQNWAISTRYKINDIIKYGGTLYVCNTGHTSNATAAGGLEGDQAKWDYLNKGFEYLGEWVNNYRYKVNDIVLFGATLYICTTHHTSVVTNNDSQLGTLQADIAKWEKFVPGLEFENSWQPDERYQPGDFVTYGGNQYVANDNVFAENPASSSKFDSFEFDMKTYRSDTAVVASNISASAADIKQQLSKTTNMIILAPGIFDITDGIPENLTVSQTDIQKYIESQRKR